MIIRTESQGTLANFTRILTECSQHDEVESLLILSCDENNFTPGEINPILQSIHLPIFGGVFPEIISENQKLSKGTIVAGLTSRPDIILVPGLSDPEIDYADYLDEKISADSSYNTMFVMVDGLSGRINEFIQGLYEVFGLDLNFIGGGAGSLSFEQRPCIYTNQGLVGDCAVLALADINSGIGVQHGWESISGPYKVTKSSGNTIVSLDWRPAFEVYKEVVEKASGLKFTDKNFFDIAKGYPFGINKMGEEKVIRDPILVNEEQHLICVGEVPTDSYVDIMKGDVSSLVHAAKKAKELGLESFTGKNAPQTSLLIDCISRVLFMEEKFIEEIEAVQDNQTSLIGALTLGEIANTGKDYLEFYNKTAVVGLLDT